MGACDSVGVRRRALVHEAVCRGDRVGYREVWRECVVVGAGTMRSVGMRFVGNSEAEVAEEPETLLVLVDGEDEARLVHVERLTMVGAEVV